MSGKPQGIIPAIVTPFTADEEIDEGPLRALASRLIDAETLQLNVRYQVHGETISVEEVNQLMTAVRSYRR